LAASSLAGRVGRDVRGGAAQLRGTVTLYLSLVVVLPLTLIDLPFALPTIVAGITLLALYGSSSPVGVDIG
jgi:ABC-type sulfate transport system permease subunit